MFIKLKVKKLLVIVVIFLMIPVFNVWAISEIPSGFIDKEVSKNNNVSAASLDMDVRADDEWNDEQTANDMLPGDSVERNISVHNVGGLDFQYKVAFQKESGDDKLCSSLQLKAKKSGNVVYEGNLNDFKFQEINLNSGNDEEWNFVLSLPEETTSLSGLDCKFDFVWTAWQKRFPHPDKGWVNNESVNNDIHTGIETPVQTGYNADNGDDYATPRNPNEIACQGGYTNINHISIHWTDVAGGNAKIKYQRQYKVGVNGNWSGNEIYVTPYTNYRTFGRENGHEGIYGSRVRAWKDENGNNKIDVGESVSDWSNECSITYDITPPAVPTGLRRLSADHSKVFDCGDLIKIQKVHPDWDDNTEDDFDHYEYTSFNAPNGSIGLNEKEFKDSIFEYNGSWLPKDGTYGFTVRAVDKAGNKSAWAGGAKDLAHSCQIIYDSTAPKVRITNPTEGESLSGKVKIKGTVTDAHPHHYWLVIQNSQGQTVAGPGVVNEVNSFTDKKLFEWDTTKFSDGDYVIKLEARDQLGNKKPNQAPIANDPENPNDSVDWINVKVKNHEIGMLSVDNPHSYSIDGDNFIGKIVLNEFVPRPKPDKKEWVELYNNTDKDIDVAGWFISDKNGPDSHMRKIDKNHTDTGDTIVKAKGWLVVKKYNSFYLNDSGDAVKLFDKDGHLVDKYTYDDATKFDRGKSFARLPDGTGDWVDPVATPGEKNERMESEKLSVVKRSEIRLVWTKTALKTKNEKLNVVKRSKIRLGWTKSAEADEKRKVKSKKVKSEKRKMKSEMENKKTKNGAGEIIGKKEKLNEIERSEIRLARTECGEVSSQRAKNEKLNEVKFSVADEKLKMKSEKKKAENEESDKKEKTKKETEKMNIETNDKKTINKKDKSGKVTKEKKKSEVADNNSEKVKKKEEKKEKEKNENIAGDKSEKVKKREENIKKEGESDEPKTDSEAKTTL